MLLCPLLLVRGSLLCEMEFELGPRLAGASASWQRSFGFAGHLPGMFIQHQELLVEKLVHKEKSAVQTGLMSERSESRAAVMVT